MKLFPSRTEPVFVSDNFRLLALLICNLNILSSKSGTPSEWACSFTPKKGYNVPVKTHYIFVFFGIYTHYGPTSFFHSIAISIIECEHNRNHMITSCVLIFLSFLGLFSFIL